MNINDFWVDRKTQLSNQTERNFSNKELHFFNARTDQDGVKYEDMGNCLKSPTSDDISLLHESQSDRASFGDGTDPDLEPPPPYQVREAASSHTDPPVFNSEETKDVLNRYSSYLALSVNVAVIQLYVLGLLLNDPQVQNRHWRKKMVCFSD